MTIHRNSTALHSLYIKTITKNSSVDSLVDCKVSMVTPLLILNVVHWRSRHFSNSSSKMCCSIYTCNLPCTEIFTACDDYILHAHICTYIAYTYSMYVLHRHTYVCTAYMYVHMYVCTV